MNGLGFGAVTIICVTLIIIVGIIAKLGFTVRVEKKDTTELKPPVLLKETKPDPVEAKQVSKELEEELNKKNLQASMDAVIKSANQLMGIEVEEEQDGKE